MRLATIRTGNGTRAVRVDDDAAVETGHRCVGELLKESDWRGVADFLVRAAGVTLTLNAGTVIKGEKGAAAKRPSAPPPAEIAATIDCRTVACGKRTPNWWQKDEAQAPPAMIASVPFSAPTVPPETGASI